MFKKENKKEFKKMLYRKDFEEVAKILHDYKIENNPSEFGFKMLVYRMSSFMEEHNPKFDSSLFKWKCNYGTAEK